MQLFHGLLRQGWCFLYSRANSSEFDDFSADSDSFLPLASSSLEPLAMQDGSDGSCPKTVDQHFETANESREVLKRKEFVRARKAREWIMDENMAINLVQVVVGTGPNESYLPLDAERAFARYLDWPAWPAASSPGEVGPAWQVTSVAEFG